jgi:hypothetical protein
MKLPGWIDIQCFEHPFAAPGVHPGFNVMESCQRHRRADKESRAVLPIIPFWVSDPLELEAHDSPGQELLNVIQV